MFFSSSSSSLFLLLILQTLTSVSLSQPTVLSAEKCGNFTVSFPFHLSAGVSSAAFRLSCTNSSLFLHLDRRSYRVIELFSDGLLVDFPLSPVCRQFNDLSSFAFSGDEYFGISLENVVGLYDCEDSSLCKAGCETNDLPGCDSGGGDLGCCYPLSDHSAWRVGDEFSVFRKYGCRGFSSWAVPRGTNSGKRGVKLEWAIPRNSSAALCDRNARTVNATAVEGGVRCVCQDGFVGDGFVSGTGCLKSCYKDGKEAFGEKCDGKRHHGKKLTVLAGVLAPVFILGSLVAVFCLLKRPTDDKEEFDVEQVTGYNYHSSVSFRKVCRARLFAYRELEDATKTFQDSHKLAEGKNGTIYTGNLVDGSTVAIHKIHCENQRELVEISSQIDHLSTVFHKNLARIIGFCMDCGYTPLVVYENPGNGTLEDHLYPRESKTEQGLDWFKRVNIAAEVAGLLAFLQYETYPPILHENITLSYIFLDDDFHAKVSGFGLQTKLGPKTLRENLRTQNNNMYSFALLLLEIITGLNMKQETVTQVLQKMRSGKLEEIVDPSLYYHEQPLMFREQIGLVADIATRCILFGGDGKFGMVDASRELMQIVGGGGKKGDGIEETFSNSSLLQMISMSPDSVYLPKT
ncbi:PREDICTED: probably inactive receptor-like protein kinase At2g46850 [Tarenaya hassleriana]|uniref:probably inactive receptor-like protein kinase At2g46850 n=1 Tax=Tarenaya hassleriana TaxID=28532 RepID=UPI00053C2E69|nr:PREDICTED: probably inactive receptor-like protein kinase At2g46850 [Tarenaya hassleriana]